MELFNDYFEYPDLYFLLEEIIGYANIIVIPVGESWLTTTTKSQHYHHSYPINELMVSIVDLLSRSVCQLSPSFINIMVTRNR